MIKYAVSNIAWTSNRDQEVAELLKNTIFTGIEIAPSRYFADVENTPGSDFVALKNYWANLGFPITSLQSLLFNRPDLKLFESEDSRKKLAKFLLSLGEKAGLLGAGPLVFGSPKNRDRGDLLIEEANYIAQTFFQELCAEWPKNSSYLVLEANPEIYECNFITKSSEALRFVKSVNSERFRWHLDLACTELGNESIIELVLSADVLPSHIHISEVNLSPLLNSNISLYRDFLVALDTRGYEGVVTLEMRQTKNIDDFRNSVEILNRVYR